MSSASKSPVLPEQFGRYTNVRPLGQGGMGAVYRAHDPKLERDVVLKVCLLADNSVAKERFRREAKAAASLAPHQNLCPVYEFDVLDGIAYLTMAFVEGPTLHAWMTQRGGLNPREAALMVAKLAVAMQVAHDGGVVHRDLKPANIVINKQGEPVILDFGLARQLDEAGTRLTQLGAIYGTPAYMAPEQAGGDPVTVGPAADIYALGVILYEFLTGQLPFTGESPMLLLVNTINTPPLPLRQRNPAVDADLEAICLKALAKKPEGRQGSMNDLAAVLAEAGRAAPSIAKLVEARHSTNPRGNGCHPYRLPAAATRAPRSRPVELIVQHPHAAGIDVHSDMHMVCVPAGHDPEPVRRFGANTCDLEAIADWLQHGGDTTVTLESTDVYWIPLFELLEARGFEVWLVEPGQLSHCGARPKTDVLDCQWIQRLHSCGLLRPSFRPPESILTLRGYRRQRQMQVRYATSHVQHMQKALEQMNVKLTGVVADIVGATGRRIPQ